MTNAPGSVVSVKIMPPPRAADGLAPAQLGVEPAVGEQRAEPREPGEPVAGEELLVHAGRAVGGGELLGAPRARPMRSGSPGASTAIFEKSTL